jgi:predicted ABC-type ATPase
MLAVSVEHVIAIAVASSATARIRERTVAGGHAMQYPVYLRIHMKRSNLRPKTR